MMNIGYDYTLEPITQVKLCQEGNINNNTAKRIKSHALGSLYRMNSGSADCYAFTPYNNDWDGGWDWSQTLVDTDATHLLMLNQDKPQFYRIKYKTV